MQALELRGAYDEDPRPLTASAWSARLDTHDGDYGICIWVADKDIEVSLTVSDLEQLLTEVNSLIDATALQESAHAIRMVDGSPGPVEDRRRLIANVFDKEAHTLLTGSRTGVDTPEVDEEPVRRWHDSWSDDSPLDDEPDLSWDEDFWRASWRAYNALDPDDLIWSASDDDPTCSGCAEEVDRLNAEASRPIRQNHYPDLDHDCTD